MSTLKVGDKVRVTKDIDFHGFEIGEVVELVSLGFDGIHKFSDGSKSRYMTEGSYELIPKFKVGDKVRSKAKAKRKDYFWVIDAMIDDYDVLTISSIDNIGYSGETEIKVHENRYSYHPTWLELVKDEKGGKDVKNIGYTIIAGTHFGSSHKYQWLCDRELFDTIQLNDLVLVDTKLGEQVVQVVEKKELLNKDFINKKVIKKVSIS